MEHIGDILFKILGDIASNMKTETETDIPPVDEQLMEIKVRKMALFLTESELTKLLASDPELFKSAIIRGKYTKRWGPARQSKEGLAKSS